MKIEPETKPVMPPAIDANRFGYLQIGMLRYILLCVAVWAQAATIIITWELWEIRSTPPNLPILALPQISFGIFLLVSLVGLLIDPLRGFVLHVAVMVAACLLDQYRMQPQCLANIVLMLATLGRRGQLICFWFLAAMWFWAGLHKAISSHWFAHASFFIFTRADISRDVALQWHALFAWAVVVAEMGLGVLALLRIRLAAYGCVLLHLGIVIMLFAIEWNYSVIPWNLATAAIGFWVLSSMRETKQTDSKSGSPHYPLQIIVAILFFLAPIGFYFGVYDHGYANVLYSDLLPRGRITGQKKLHTIRGWDRINVPFPSERRTLRLYFELVAEPGDKFHIRDPRPKLPDQYFLLNGDRKAELISESHFYASGKSEVAGVGLDDRSASFYLRQWGEITQRYYKTEDGSRDNLVSFAFTFSPAHYLPQRLRHLRGLPNLTELQLEGCAVEDDDLKQVALLPRLRGIGLNNTGVTDEGIKHLAGLSALDIVETEGTRVSRSGLRWLQKKLKLQH